MKRNYPYLKRIVGLTLTVCLFSTAAFAQIGENDSTFNIPDNSINHMNSNYPVRASATQNDNSKFVLAGDFTTYNSENHNRIIRILANGTVDAGFNTGSGFDKSPASVAIQADNRVLVGGSFTEYNGISVNGFIRLNEDGSLDNQFAASSLGTSTKIKIQNDGKFYALSGNGLARINADGTLDSTFTNTGKYGGKDYAVQPDGKIILASDATDSLHLIRLFSDGSLDTSFRSDLAVRPSSFDHSWPDIHAIGLQPDGKVIIGGAYSIPNSQDMLILRRVNTDGSADSTFTLDFKPNVIYSINVQNDSKIIIAGDAGRAPGGEEHTHSRYIARLNDDGSTDDSFLHDNKYINVSSVYTTTLLSNGKVLVGGSFDQLNTYTTNNVALLNSNGMMDSNFNTFGGVNGTIRATAIQTDQKILIGGLFSSVQSLSRNHIARLLPDGGVDASFNPGNGTNGPVYAIVSQADGKTIVGGEFTDFDTDTVQNIVRLNADGSIDHTFQSSITGIVYSLELQSDNKIIVGGSFSNVNSEPRFNIARLNTDGSMDNSFEPVFPVTETNGNTIYTSQVLPNQQILIGGTFSVNSKIGLIRLNMDGTIDSGFIQKYYNDFRDLALQPDGKIIVVGVEPPQFGTRGGYVKRLNTDGSTDTSWTTTSGPDYILYTVTLLSSGQVLIGGEFDWFPESPTPYLTLLDSTGKIDSSFVGNINGPVYALQPCKNDKVLVAGDFYTYSGNIRNNITRILTTNDIPDGIKDHTTNASFRLYPNPANSFINIDNLNKESTITIRNVTGAVIYSERVTGNHSSVNISNFANGIYFMTQQSKAEISTQRFIVNK